MTEIDAPTGNTIRLVLSYEEQAHRLHMLEIVFARVIKHWEDHREAYDFDGRIKDARAFLERKLEG